MVGGVSPIGVTRRRAGGPDTPDIPALPANGHKPLVGAARTSRK